MVPAVGASGAIAGVLGSYFVLFPYARIVVLVPIFFFPFFFELPAAFYLGFWILTQVFSGTLALASPQQVGGVAWWAHVGGFTAGILLQFLFVKRGGPYRRPARDEYGVRERLDTGQLLEAQSMTAGDIIWWFFILSALQPVIKQRFLEVSRQRLIARIERERKSRVILLVHRQETHELPRFSNPSLHRHQRFRGSAACDSSHGSRGSARYRPAYPWRDSSWPPCRLPAPSTNTRER